MTTARRSSSEYGGFADGLVIRGMPILTLFPGNVYWVDSNGGGGSRGTFSHPVPTWLEAHALVTSDNGDIICIKPNHAETPTATVAYSKSGFATIGLGFGDNRPTFTNGLTGASDYAFDFAGDDVLIHNIKWKEAAAAGSDETIFNFSGSFVHIDNCYLELGGDTIGILEHDTTLATNLHFTNNTIVGTAANPDYGVKFLKEHFYAYISGNRWLLGQSAGIDSGCVIFTSGVGGGHLIESERVVGNAGPYLLQTVAQIDSLILDFKACDDDATVALGASPASGFGFINCMATEPGKGVPAVIDYTGSYPLNTTPAP